jgi:uncharacterized membrane protein
MTQENNYSEEIIESLNSINKSIEGLNQKIELQNERISQLEGRQVEASFTASASSPLPPPAPAPAPANMEYQEIASSQVQPIATATAESNFEENIGGKWFARIGMAALFLGLSFFLKYAFDNNWIGPVGRVMIGIAFGVILLGLGERFIKKYFIYGQLLNGGGLAVLYLSIFAAYNFYSLIDQIPAFFIMTLITLAGIFFSIRYDAISLIIVSTLGGFLTPFLISNGQNNEVGLLSYVLILDLAILAVSVFKKWRGLNIMGFFGTVLVFLTWAGEFYREDDIAVTMLFLTLFFAVYSISSLIYNLVRKEKSSGVEQMLTLMTGVIYFASSYAIVNPEHHSFMGFFALIMAVYYFLWANLVRAITPDDENLYSFLAFLTVGFITLAIPIQFEGKVITVGWVIEAVIMLILGIKIDKTIFRAFGIFMFGLATMRLVFVDSWHGEKDMVLFNETMLTYIIVIVLAYVSAYIFKVFSRDAAEKSNFLEAKQLVSIFLIMANFLTIYSLSREITFNYDKEIKLIEKQERKESLAQEKVDVGSFQPYKNFNVSQEKINKLENKSSVSLSLFWLFYGIILMLIGFFARIKGVRVGGLLLFTLAILKLFFYDLWSMGTLYRIISSMSLGMVLLAISFAYQKYQDKIKEIL